IGKDHVYRLLRQPFEGSDAVALDNGIEPAIGGDVLGEVVEKTHCRHGYTGNALHLLAVMVTRSRKDLMKCTPRFAVRQPLVYAPRLVENPESAKSRHEHHRPCHL